MSRIAGFFVLGIFLAGISQKLSAAPSTQMEATIAQPEAVKFRDSLVHIFKACDAATGHMIDVKGLGKLNLIIESAQTMKKSCADADRNIHALTIPTTLGDRNSILLPNIIQSCKISYAKKVAFADILEKIDSLHPSPEYMEKLNVEYQTWDIHGQICKRRLKRLFEELGLNENVFDRVN